MAKEKAEKATKKAAPAKKSDGMIGTSELATKLKIDSKKLRLILRKNEVEKEEGRYAWKPDSQFVTKTAPKMVAEYEANAAKEKAEKPAKKSAKKATKKATKKAKPEPEESEEEAEEETDEL